MSDTQRDTPTLQGLFADNSSGKITPQMLRDMLVSMFGGYAWIYVENGAVAQTVNVAPTLLTGFAANGVASGPVPDNTTDKITVTVAGDYWIDGEFAFTGTALRTIQMQLRKNGVAVPGIRSRAKLDASGDVLELSFAGILTCVANDQLSVFTAADLDASSITLVDGALSIRRVG